MNFIDNSNKELYIKGFYISFIILLIIIIIYYVYSKINLLQSNCDTLTKIYNSNPTINCIPDNMLDRPLRDFYIKTAYNCCATGKFYADFVGLCALQTCIQQGVRCLDFEIYSIDNEPVIAVSPNDNFTSKESFNSIPIADAFKMIKQLAFNNTACQNYTDPLLLHFRIFSKNVPMYTNLTNQIKTILSSNVLDSNYSYEYNSGNLGAVSIRNFINKIIIIVDTTNPLYRSTPLDEYVNIGSSTPFMRLLRYDDVKYTQDLLFKEFNKKNMSIVLPNRSYKNSNPNFLISSSYGCQLIGMSFQNYDSNLEHYNFLFDSNKTAFLVKPPELCYIPTTIKEPEKAPISYSYASRSISTNKSNSYYNYSI